MDSIDSICFCLDLHDSSRGLFLVFFTPFIIRARPTPRRVSIDIHSPIETLLCMFRTRILQVADEWGIVSSSTLTQQLSAHYTDAALDNWRAVLGSACSLFQFRLCCSNAYSLTRNFCTRMGFMKPRGNGSSMLPSLGFLLFFPPIVFDVLHSNPPHTPCIRVLTFPHRMISHACMHLYRCAAVVAAARDRFVFFSHFFESVYLVMHGSDSNDPQSTMVLQTVLVMNLFSSLVLRTPLERARIHASNVVDRNTGSSALGNPTQLINHLGTGMRDMVKHPADGWDQGYVHVNAPLRSGMVVLHRCGSLLVFNRVYIHCASQLSIFHSENGDMAMIITHLVLLSVCLIYLG